VGNLSAGVQAIYLGRVLAPNEQQAIKVAIKEIPVSNLTTS
jgi:hypothetical protein